MGMQYKGIERNRKKWSEVTINGIFHARVGENENE